MGTQDVKVGPCRLLQAELLGPLFLVLLRSAIIGFAVIFAHSVAFHIAAVLIFVGIFTYFHRLYRCQGNTAITFGMIVAGNMPVLKGLLYVAAQMCGITTGLLLLKLVPWDITDLLRVVLLSGSMMKAIDFVLQFFLGLAMVLRVLTKDKYPEEKDRDFTMCFVFLNLFMVYTPMIYWAGTIIGGIAAGHIVKLITSWTKYQVFDSCSFRQKRTESE